MSRLEKLRQHEARLEELRRRLGEARATFDKPQADLDLEPDAPHQGREGISMALDAVLDYLRAELEDSHLTALLRTLFAAIGDIDDGISNPLLERRKRSMGGRPRAPKHNSLQLALASAVVTQFILAGTSKLEALKMVTAKVPGLTPSQLASWRDKVTSREIADSDAIELYWKVVRRGDGLEPAVAADNLLACLGEMVVAKPQKKTSREKTS